MNPWIFYIQRAICVCGLGLSTTALAEVALPMDADLLPKDSDLAMMKWVDKQHEQMQQRLFKHAHRLNDWAGDWLDAPVKKQPRAQLRILLDNTWDKYNEFDTSIRIRGSLRIPNAEHKLRVVFGDDTLDDEQQQNVVIDPTLPHSPANIDNAQDPNSLKAINDKALEDNASIALRWLGPMLGDFRSDLDLGIRSGTDIYTRAQLGKTWMLDPVMSASLDQTVRYGLESKLFARTNLELVHQAPARPSLSYLLSLTYSEPEKEQGFAFSHRISRLHHFWDKQDFSYGLLWSGNIKDEDLNLDSYGPWMSWRQPFIRQWFYIRGDVNYFNHRDLDQDHHLSTFLRLEAEF